MTEVTVTADHTLAFQDDVGSPTTMAEALDFDDPVQALKLLAKTSQKVANIEAEALAQAVSSFRLKLPEIKVQALHSSSACSDSILQSLSKISQGGSQASQEIRELETSKRELQDHADAVERALILRRSADAAFPALQRQDWFTAAEAVQPWLELRDNPNRVTEAYAGQYCTKQLATAYGRLKEELLQKYEKAVQESDLQGLGQLTPILGTVQLEPDAVRLYLQYLAGVLQESLKTDPQEALHIQTARVYNAAVNALRHHLPLVSHCLHKADGDSAVVQLVHVKVEETAVPILEGFSRERQLSAVSERAQQISAALEERTTGRRLTAEDAASSSHHDEDEDDCGFSVAIGSLGDVDVAMDETARFLQHAESYLRFVEHTCAEVNKARRLRFQQVQEQKRLQRDRKEWKGGKKAENKDSSCDDGEDQTFTSVQILPETTTLHLSITEIGGQYASVERCLLLATMQRAFVTNPSADPRHFRAASLPNLPRSCRALQTSVVEACLYAARHGAQRAFATGHAITASAVANFFNDSLSGVLLDVLSHRAEDSGVALLKPGEGLLVGSAGLFNNASNLIRQGTTHTGVTGRNPNDDFEKKQKMEQDLSRACAVLNDLEVACHQTQQLGELLGQAVTKGFAPDQPETNQLHVCVKALESVTDSFRVAATGTMGSLEPVLRPRLRSIVSEAIGSDNSSTTFMAASSVMGGGKTTDRVMARMNYDLDEETYNLMQLTEGYVTRLCTLLNELLEPLRYYLVPRLWDALFLLVIGTVCKRLESSMRKCQFTALGALTLDSEVRDVLGYVKDHLISPEYSANNVAVTRACTPLSRLLQIAKLLSVDDLDDVLDLIGSAKRKGAWDLKLEEAKDLLCLRVEFEDSKVKQLLRLPDDS